MNKINRCSSHFARPLTNSLRGISSRGHGFSNSFRREFSSNSANANRYFLNSSITRTLLIGVVSICIFNVANVSTQPKVKLEAPVESPAKDNFTDDARRIDKSIDPFPYRISVAGSPFSLFGLGMRTVSFLRINVYAVGIYIAEDDLAKVRTCIKEIPENDSDLETMLTDPVMGKKLFRRMLDDGVRFSLRIVPVRNTDFGHLRDGFIRSIMAKSKNEDVDLNEGIAQLRTVFSRKRVVPKNGELRLSTNTASTLCCDYYSKPGDPAEFLGSVEDKSVTTALLLHYITAPQAASEQAQKSFVTSLARYVSY
ncbi:chalcone-flavanone isomerase-domain-containing protein [Dipodascopsis uninucleata]